MLQSLSSRKKCSEIELLYEAVLVSYNDPLSTTTWKYGDTHFVMTDASPHDK